MRPRKRASLIHLIALVLLAMLVGGAVGYVYTGVIFDPVHANTVSDTIEYRRILRTQRFLKSIGVKNAKGGFVLGAVIGGCSMTSFLVRTRFAQGRRSEEEKI